MSESEQCECYEDTRADLLDKLLFDAVLENNLDAVKYILKKGGNPKRYLIPENDDHEFYRLSIFNIAVFNGFYEAVKLFLESGIIDANGQYGDIGARQCPIIFAAENGSIPIAKLLIEYGAKLDPIEEERLSLDWEGEIPTPLIAAVKEKRFGMARFLIEQGSDVDLSIERAKDVGLNDIATTIHDFIHRTNISL